MPLAVSPRRGDGRVVDALATGPAGRNIFSQRRQIDWILSKAELVQSTRGIKGGYSLMRPASEIRLNQVIRVLEGEPAESHCKATREFSSLRSYRRLRYPAGNR